LDKGASAAEVLEVIQLTVLLCHDTFEVGLPILQEELAARGISGYPSLTPAQRELKERYIARVGRWPAGADMLFSLAPNFVGAFLDYAEIPHGSGPLSPKIKAFIGIALRASPASPRPDLLRPHIGAALDAGATAGEIVDVLQLTSAIAIHSCTIGVPALAEVASRRAAR
jgi:alkylhydroperoxidase/carboxymuconolactone decarboxylase family protein YurZ